MNTIASLVIVDDEKNTREGLKTLLLANRYDVDIFGDPYTAIEFIQHEKPDIVLTDLKMPAMDGLTLMRKIKAISPETLVIVFTAYGTVENAVKAIQSGAFHYLTKPVNTLELIEILKKAVARKKLEEENRELKMQLKEKNEFNDIIYQSTSMKALIATVEQVAPSTASVLIEGESGTGKELFARMIHQLSLRKKEPFIPVHCASISETLLSSELFGHEKGAFTGAVDRKQGRFERANNGTIFLDEIGELKESMQVSLLRVLQEKEFERVGGTKLIKVDVRLITATNKNLQEQVKKNLFRDDLFFRLNVVSLKIPPLRERVDDITPLINYYLAYYAKVNHKKIEFIDSEAMQALSAYHWPGNVREVKNIVERMVVLAKQNVIKISNVPHDIKGTIEYNSKDVQPKPRATFVDSSQAHSLKDVERDLIVFSLNEFKGNKSKVAKKIGISRRTLYRKLKEYNIE